MGKPSEHVQEKEDEEEEEEEEKKEKVKQEEEEEEEEIEVEEEAPIPSLMTGRVTRKNEGRKRGELQHTEVNMELASSAD